MAAAVDAREQWHWQEVDLNDWLKRWLTLNVNQAVLIDTSTHFLRCREAYKDSGECLVHCRKGQFFATCAFRHKLMLDSHGRVLASIERVLASIERMLDNYV